MRCAIYARKSTDEPDKHDEDKSTTRQIDHARQFIEGKGWTVAEEHTYVDDGISGAEFQNRPGFQALIAALKPKAFDAIVCSEPSRLGRHATYTAYHILQIVDAGVRIFYYLTGEEEKADTPEARLIGNIKGYADEMERVRARQRVRDAHYRLASQGFSTGTKVYGYRSVPVYTGGDNPSHVKQEILPEEAHVVRRIFQMYADGYGLKRVARHLNSEGIPAPRSDGWWDGTIRAMLHQELYRGNSYKNSFACREAKRRCDSSSVCAPTLCTKLAGNWRPSTAKRWRRAFSSGASRSIRAARMSCTVCGICKSGACRSKR